MILRRFLNYTKHRAANSAAANSFWLYVRSKWAQDDERPITWLASALFWLAYAHALITSDLLVNQDGQWRWVRKFTSR